MIVSSKKTELCEFIRPNIDSALKPIQLLDN